MNTHVTPDRHSSDRHPTFRISNPVARVTLGTVASAAVFAASALLFGPVSDQRALAMAGTPATRTEAGGVDKGGAVAAASHGVTISSRTDERSSEDVALGADLHASPN